MRWRGIVLLFAAIAASAVLKADDLPLPAGHQRWIVVLKDSANQNAPAAIDEIAAAASGRVESTLPSRLVIAAPPSVLGQLLAHPDVKYVQPVSIGVPDSFPETADLTADRNVPIQTNALTWTSGEYRYDGAGNITSIGTPGAPGTQGYRTYGYDFVSRLTKAQIGATPATTQEYAYDAYGNRSGYALNQQWVTVPASPTNNRLTDATYDAAGNQLARGATAATYDGFGMLTSYRFDAVSSETFVYTPNDERIGVLRGTEWTWSVRDASGKVLRQYRNSSTNPTAAWLWIEDFVYRDGLLLGSERVGEEGGRHHYHLDPLGSPRLVTGASGCILSEHDFLPFGEERTSIRQHQAKGFDREEPHRFTGHERDFDTAAPNESSSYVDSMHARYYRGTAGRFLSVDPAMDLEKILPEPQLWNRYAYVGNNPLRYTDPDGRERLAYWHFNRQPVPDRGFKTEMISTASTGLMFATMLGIPMPGEAMLGRAFGAGARFLGIGGSGLARGSVTLETAIASGAVREGGALSKIIGGIEAGFKSGAPKSAEKAFELVAKSAEAAGKEPGTLVKATEGAKYVLQNVGDLKTFIYKTGEAIVKKGDEVLVRYIPK